MPEYRGLWIALGGFGSFAASAIVWREVEEGRHPAQRSAAPVGPAPALVLPLPPSERTE